MLMVRYLDCFGFGVEVRCRLVAQFRWKSLFQIELPVAEVLIVFPGLETHSIPFPGGPCVASETTEIIPALTTEACVMVPYDVMFHRAKREFYSY